MVHPQPIAEQDAERLIHSDNTTELDSYVLANGEVVQAPHPFSIPTDPRYLHPWTGRITCVARREGGAYSRNERIVFYAQGIPGVYNSRALFVAQRHPISGAYWVYNVYNDDSLLQTQFHKTDQRYVGKLTRHKHHEGYVDFRLVRGRKGEEIQASSLIYNSASLKYPIVNGSTDRIVYSIIHTNEEPKDDEAQERDMSIQSVDNDKDKKFKEKGPRSIDDVAKSVLKTEVKGLHAIRDQYKNVSVFQSRRRFTDKRGRSLHGDMEQFVYRFGRRVMEVSKKNLQIVDVQTGLVIFQMGRWDDAEFTVDFLAPYTPYEAFGIALAQFEMS